MRLRTHALALLTGLALSVPAGAVAAEFKSVAEAGVMYDAPSVKAKPLYVAARATPMEVVRTQAGWIKLREPGGRLGWMETRLLSDQRSLIVTVARARILSEAAESAALAFEAEKGVLLEPLPEPAPAGWAHVKHRDGQSGFVRIQQIWGL